jgi:magnesium transporter
VSDAQVPAIAPAGGDPQTPGPAAGSVTTAVPPKCPTRTRLYRAGALVTEGFPAEDISEYLGAQPNDVVWLDLHDPDEADLQIVTQEFGLHPLAVEDAVHEHQRPKLDRYRSHLFANMYAVRFDERSGELQTSEISAFITPRALITVRKQEFDIDALLSRWDDSPELAENGVGFLVHGLLDAVVDGHYNAVQQLDEGIDDLEDRLFEPRPGVDIRRRGFELRKSLVQLRHVVIPMRELVSRLLRSDTHLVTDPMDPYYQDVYDHVLRAAESVDSARDLVASILETNLNEQSYELNQITRKLAAWAAIIAVPTAVTGFYGQNVPYPGFSQHWGFVTSTAIILVLSSGLFLLLRRNKWL